MAWISFLLLILMIVVGIQAAEEQDGSVRDYDEVIMPPKE